MYTIICYTLNKYMGVRAYVSVFVYVCMRERARVTGCSEVPESSICYIYLTLRRKFSINTYILYIHMCMCVRVRTCV